MDRWKTPLTPGDVLFLLGCVIYLIVWGGAILVGLYYLIEWFIRFWGH